jgi:protein TonB
MATPALHPTIRPDWRNIGALSVALSLHTGLLMVLFAPAAATDAPRTRPQPPSMVYVEAEPLPPAPPPPPAPPQLPPRPAQHPVTPPSPPVVADPVLVETAPSPTNTAVDPLPEESTAAVAAPVDVPASEMPGYRSLYPVQYPQRAAVRGLEGEVVLRVLVGTDGRPLRIELHRSSRHGVLDRAALQAVREWRFRPEVRAGVTIEGWVLVPIAFSMGGG